jgi:hypothetical protein
MRKRGASFISLLILAHLQPRPNPGIILMALRHDANDASLSRIADDLIGIREVSIVSPRVSLARAGVSHLDATQ